MCCSNQDLTLLFRWYWKRNSINLNVPLLMWRSKISWSLQSVMSLQQFLFWHNTTQHLENLYLDLDFQHTLECMTNYPHCGRVASGYPRRQESHHRSPIPPTGHKIFLQHFFENLSKPIRTFLKVSSRHGKCHFLYTIQILG